LIYHDGRLSMIIWVEAVWAWLRLQRVLPAGFGSTTLENRGIPDRLTVSGPANLLLTSFLLF